MQQLKEKISKGDTYVLCKEFNSRLNKLANIACKKHADDIQMIEARDLIRSISRSNELVLIDMLSEHIWSNKSIIENKDESQLFNINLSKYAKFQYLIDLIKNDIKNLNNAEKEYIWSLLEGMLLIIGYYRSSK